MDIQDVAATRVFAHLSNRFEEGEAFDVANRAADLGDHYFGCVRRLRLGGGVDARLDLVRDMRDDLHRATEVIAVPLLLENRRVNLAGRDIRGARERFVNESFVVPQIEVRLRAVVRDEDLTVLVRGHRARVHIEVRIELDDRDGNPPAFQQPTNRSDGNSFANR